MQITNKNTFTTEQTAKNFGTSIQSLAQAKRNHADELIENIHYFKVVEQTNGGKQKLIKWTLKGIVVLGFFIRSPQAKNFRIWASNQLEKELLKQADEYASTRQRNLELTDKVADLNAVLIDKAKRHQREINGYKSQLVQHNKQITILRHELEKATTRQTDVNVIALSKANERISEAYRIIGAVMANVQGDEYFIKNMKGTQ